MPSGGVLGRPVVVNGKSTTNGPGPATIVVRNLRDYLVNPLNKERSVFVYSIHVINHSATNSLKVYLDDQPEITVVAGATFHLEALIGSVAVQAEANTVAYEMLLTVAA